jgi:hypothetical protein
MLLAGFKPTIPVFKLAKTFHALGRAATVTGNASIYFKKVIRVCLIITSCVEDMSR